MGLLEFANHHTYQPIYFIGVSVQGPPYSCKKHAYLVERAGVSQ